MSEVNRYIVDCNRLWKNGKLQHEVDVSVVLSTDFDRVTAERDAALGREAALKEVTCFKDAVACVFDNLKMVACNTDDRAWDDRLEDLAEDVIEMAPEYKKQWKDVCRLTAENLQLQQRLTAADERADVLEGLLREAWEYDIGTPLKRKIIAAIKPAEGLDRRDMAAKVHLMKREGGGDA